MHVLMLIASLAAASPDPDSSGPADPAESVPTATPAPKDKGPIFPIWNRKIREAGFDLPPALGVMVNYYYQRSAILISDLQIGVNNGPLRDASVIEFGEATAHANALAIRPSFMLLPFLSFYTVIS